MRLISGLLLIVALSACNLGNAPMETQEVDIEITVTPIITPSPTIHPTTTLSPSPTIHPTTTSIPTNVATECNIVTGWFTYTVISGDTLFNLAQRANSNVDTLVNANCLKSADVLSVGQVLYLPQTIEANTSNFVDVSDDNIVYWLAAEVPETGFIIEVGCGTYLRQFDTGISRSTSPETNIRIGLEALFNSPIEGYRNHWQGLSLETIDVVDGLATIVINGDFLLGGICSDPEILEQVLLIIFAEPEVQTASISVDDMNLRQISDASGRSGANAVFTR